MRSRTFLAAALFASWCAAATRGIEIEVGPKNRISGYVVREDAASVTVRVISPDGKDKVATYERTKAKIIHQVSRERLEKLSPEKPKDYRTYAEELAIKSSDPEARETALRLFLIAASLDPRDSGPICLAKMSKLAATPAEARRYRAMAILLDPNGDPRALKKESLKATVPGAGPEAKGQMAALASFQQALRCCRAGLVNEAKEFAKRDGVDKIFAAAPGMMDQKAFLQTCSDTICPTCRLKKVVKCTTCGGRGKAIGMFGNVEVCSKCGGRGEHKCGTCDGAGVNPAFPDDQLRMIVQAELWAMECLAGGEIKGSSSAGDRGWSSALKSQQINAVPAMTLETISEYDPRKSVFRNGSWVAP